MHPWPWARYTSEPPCAPWREVPSWFAPHREPCTSQQSGKCGRSSAQCIRAIASPDGGPRLTGVSLCFSLPPHPQMSKGRQCGGAWEAPGRHPCLHSDLSTPQGVRGPPPTYLPSPAPMPGAPGAIWAGGGGGGAGAGRREAQDAWPQGEGKVDPSSRLPRAPLSSPQSQDCFGVQPKLLKPFPPWSWAGADLPSRCAHICLPAASHRSTAAVQPVCTSMLRP